LTLVSEVVVSMMFWPPSTLVASALAALTFWLFGVGASQGGLGAGAVVVELLVDEVEVPDVLVPLPWMPSLER
jgi:hypothetical protein